METKKNNKYIKSNKSKSLGQKPKKKKKIVKPKILHWVKRQSIISAKRNERVFNFKIDWSRVEITDKTTQRIGQYMKISEEDAFDRALDILELHDNYRVDARWIYREWMKKKFRGNWIHLQWHTYENMQIGIENNRWTRVNYNEDHAYFPETTRQAIYDAEDGRCESCGQPMHIRIARFVKRDWSIFNDPDNIKLLCYCCGSGRKNMLLNPELIILDRNLSYLKDNLGMNDEEEVITFLRANLKYAVHTNTFNPNKQKKRKQVKDMKMLGQYWLPGIGRCRLKYQFNDQQKKEYTLEFTECASKPELRIKVQERSRNLLI